MQGREILIGVTGGIAAYKTAALVSQLVQAGAGVSVVLTDAAKEFVGPATFEALTGRPVPKGQFGDPSFRSALTSSWPAAPKCSASLPQRQTFWRKPRSAWPTILLSTLYLAFRGPVIVAPAMNAEMWSKPAVQRGVAQLRRRRHDRRPRRRLAKLPRSRPGPHGGTRTINGGDRGVALKTTGKSTPRLTVDRLSWRRILITSGPTRQHLDPVRYLDQCLQRPHGPAWPQAAAEAQATGVVVSGPVEVAYPARLRSRSGHFDRRNARRLPAAFSRNAMA